MNLINDFFAAQSEQTLVMFGLAIVLSIVFVIAGNYIKKQDPVKRPSKFMVIIDMYYGFITGLHNSMFRGHCRSILAYAAMLIVFIVTMNWIGLITPFEPPTTDYNVPLGLVIISFGFKYALEMKHMKKKEWFKTFVEPVPPMLPLNILEIVAKPLSMSMRLFGNILSGALILMIFSSALGGLQNMIFELPQVDGQPIFNLLNAIISPPLHFFFDIFFGTIQAFVFTLLTLVFSSLELDLDEMDEKEKKRMEQTALATE